ncbi:aminotransferase class V-fold PLP-dependent enzyme [Roseibium aggregatum]|uniref:Aminotransferase class V-fold PLP-dependent enzyme n=1 Tax=Roseibium aggregatum TaxID=187304 RepID=A0A926P3P3_9HYPH|nr:aminotransferase class V-fold PLP-dependent enzyme [Roseibium aggregatum]MBD1549093.1 aminotransferase class V-fold PLP-dependent enzyme [Roseibium aggregatum]
MTLSNFWDSLNPLTAVAELRDGLIGENVILPGPFGETRLVYADYTASGRALRQVEDFIAGEVLPFYANSHTEASYCGAYMTRLRAEARQAIAEATNAGSDYSVIFTGSGATAGLNRLVSLFGLPAMAGARTKPVVLIGPYEHHSNILPWRESGADVIPIPEATDGGPDLDILEFVLSNLQDRSLVIGAFSAASNVTGIVTDVDAVTALLKRHGALAVWDYAGGGPYLPVDTAPAPGLEKDAVVLSPHKFPGGPGASGVLIIRNDAVRTKTPTWPGGGTVSFVSPWGHDYSNSLIAREEAGTPNVIGDIRAALVFLVKAAAGQAFISRRDADFTETAFAAWQNHPNIRILAADRRNRLPIFSLRVTDNDGASVHPQLFTRMLSDFYGIQARGGCACAGPYAHRLLDIEKPQSEELRTAIREGREMEKPGWTRLNFSYLMSDATADYICNSVRDLADRAGGLRDLYQADPATARFKLAG